MYCFDFVDWGGSLKLCSSIGCSSQAMATNFEQVSVLVQFIVIDWVDDIADVFEMT